MSSVFNVAADPAIDISVVVVGWNARHYLELLLDSLRKYPPRRSTEVFIVDNASSDGTVEMIESRYPEVKLIKSPVNLGFTKGNNVAIREARGRYIALVNPDVILFEGCLDNLADYLDKNPKVGNVGPRVLNADLTLQSNCRRFPTLWNNFCSAFGLATKFKNSEFFAGEHMYYFAHDRVRPVDVIVGCFFVVRRECFEEVGLLDENIFIYAEEVDWCLRARKKGWPTMFCPDAEAIHDRGKITAKFPMRFAVTQQRSIIYFWKKHHGFWGVLGIRAIMFAHHLVRYMFAIASGIARKTAAANAEVRKQVSGACLRDLCFGDVVLPTD
jgi:GT2 family glycosyltransferase